MNKKEVAEIKRNFSDSSGFFTMNHVLTAFVDSDKNICCKNHKLYSIMSGGEGELFMETLKKVLGGSVAKALLEYEFPREEYEEGGAQYVFYKTLNSKLLDDVDNQAFLERIVNNIEYTSTFAVITAHCTYTLRSRDDNDEHDGAADNNFDFLITALCPVEVEENALIYDEFNNEIFKKEIKDRKISGSPSDGFMYPILSDGGADVNRVLYYTKTPKAPNESIINNVLGCEFVMTADDEKETFQKVLNDVVGDELDYTIITHVNEKIRETIDTSKNETELTVIDDIKLRDILSDIGVSDKKLETVHAVFEQTAGGKPLTATNLVSTKTVVKTPDITINIGKNATDKIRTSVIQGRKCLVIDLDDPNIIVNGLPTTVE